MDRLLDIEADARRAFDAIRKGGIAILPMDVGYSLIGSGDAALRKIFDTKRRAPSKLNAMVGDQAIHREIHLLDTRQRAIVDAIVQDHGLPLGLIAPGRMDHPLLRALSPEMLARSTKDGTVLMLLNAGAFEEAIGRLSLRHGVPLFGSSANLSLSGTKFRVEDIEPEVLGIADVVIDYGLRKWHFYRQSSTLIDIRTVTATRKGSCFDVIADILARQFAITLNDPTLA
ncbi:Sua5/YciO/YrdC/YwlC family protein [Falsiroseomonas stagni]|uniref:tRNA A37 threonylcarbamoyladenosine synthetase subunit TsaC/SUA5/YrdC n=1 Tax=Falsiroseomonas stagni DSM 19981 TaxID=1123062 RepID=A0A1I4CD76_9PROT|nr:Sua5/YciO/YrdC/YwlC family protein [Falsiroseomonas stagni]SFK78106.1 tRNA A37 threonylcarbamoyladenosine synthetase subunit TsaC/SUA5/YrdC [Falsiroseomonas stagni DSM 19981]